MAFSLSFLNADMFGAPGKGLGMGDNSAALVAGSSDFLYPNCGRAFETRCTNPPCMMLPVHSKWGPRSQRRKTYL